MEVEEVEEVVEVEVVTLTSLLMAIGQNKLAAVGRSIIITGIGTLPRRRIVFWLN